MGFRDDYKIVVNDMPAYRQAGNSIVVDVLIDLLKETDVTEIPEGVLQAEFWTDKDDHEAGTHCHPVRMVRGGLSGAENAGTPVELVQSGRHSMGHPTVHWQPLSAYNNFKGYQGGGL